MRESYLVAGLVPTTNLQRDASSLTRMFGVCCLHNMLRCTHITKTSRQAAREIVELGTSDKFEGKSLGMKEEIGFAVEGMVDREPLQRKTILP